MINNKMHIQWYRVLARIWQTRLFNQYAHTQAWMNNMRTRKDDSSTG